MLGKLGTESKERISGIIPFKIGQLKSGTNFLQTRWELSFANLSFLETDLGKQLQTG
jgi:hypothetical protein